MPKQNKGIASRIKRQTKGKRAQPARASSLRRTAPRKTPQVKLAAASAPGKDRSFISDEGFRNAVFDGRQGFKVKVRLTSYRALPLSCVEGIELKVDGEPVDPCDIVFLLNNYSFKLNELPRLSTIFWFILDYAELFVPRENGLSAGEHDIEGTLITVEPYMTAGRFSFYNSSKKRLLLESDL
jgi:hypothetical protein